MKWPFGGKEQKESSPAQPPEPTTMDRLLGKDCSRDEFALLYLKLLQEKAPEFKFEMTGDMEIRLTNPAGNEATTFLHNLWVSYSQNPPDRQEDLDRFVSVVLKLTDVEPPVSNENVVAVIKDAEYLATLSGSDPITEPFCGDLWIVYSQDLPDRIVTMKSSSLAELGCEKTALYELALENLTRILPQAECNGDGPWYWLAAGGDYTASLLLLDNIWDQLKDLVDGEIIAVVPARDTLLFTGSRSAEGLKTIKEQATQIVKNGNYVISDTLLMRKDGRWHVFNTN